MATTVAVPVGVVLVDDTSPEEQLTAARGIKSRIARVSEYDRTNLPGATERELRFILGHVELEVE